MRTFTLSLLQLQDLAAQLAALATYKMAAPVAVAIARNRAAVADLVRSLQQQGDYLLDTFAEYDAGGRFITLYDGQVSLADTRGYRKALAQLQNDPRDVSLHGIEAAQLPTDLAPEAVPVAILNAEA